MAEFTWNYFVITLAIFIIIVGGIFVNVALTPFSSGLTLALLGIAEVVIISLFGYDLYIINK